ncbi:MAG: hypothetical protein IT585_14085, partial [candidate division Zixibacteria bacterium]|nr:hypothetical protein [candidate division Zixibacteria bacterium]
MMTTRQRDWILLGCLWIAVLLLLPVGVATAQDEDPNQACLECHSDETLESEAGKSVYVKADELHNSAHKGMACLSCHQQEGANFEDVPHFTEYKP